jgi:oligopeptide/dipeptide ABC transporter ATP-binding protein
MADKPLLLVDDLVLYFRTTQGVVRAVDHVSFSLDYNKAVVVVGESGCGKSSLTKAILRLLPRNVDTYSGKVFLEGKDIMTYSEEEFRLKVRWIGMSMVPQAAMNSLNPVIRVGEQVAEPALIHMGVTKTEAFNLVRKMFQHVGVPEVFIDRYPFELSGGMRQRVAIAMALITSPSLIILDEPTSALDVLTQANIFNVLKRIKKELGTSFILITHDIATSSEIADEAAVMYAGQIVELNDARAFFNEPLHPYSRKLMASVPHLRTEKEPEFITGQPPSLVDLPAGCRFRDRCPRKFERCIQDPPVIVKDGRMVRCWLYD